MGKGVWGIDVSKSSAKAVRLEMRGQTPVLTHVEVVPYPGAEAGDSANLDQQIVDALNELKSVCRFGKEPVILSLPGHSTFNRLIKLPPVDDEKIPEIVQYEAQSQIPFNIDEVIWDYQLVEREYQPSEEKEVILFAIKRDIVEQFLQNIAGLNLNFEAIQFGPVALYNFLAYDQDLGGAAIALDMGGDNTDLIVLDGAKFWIRNLPITGNDITKALQKAFNLPFGEAEKLKLKAGQSQQAQKIFNAIQPVLRDLVGEIHRSIGYYKSISKTAKFEKIVLLGNATKTLNFQKFVSQSLSTMGNLPAARIQKLGKINADAVDQGQLNRHLGTIGTALGLAVQGLGFAFNRINLLPESHRRKKELRKKQPWIVGAVVALYLLVAVAWQTMSGQVDTLKQIKNQADAAVQINQQQMSRYENAKQVGAVEAPLKTISTISSERDLLLKIMNAINPNLPENGKLGANGLPALQPTDQLWIVDWKCEEEARVDKKADPGAGASGIQKGEVPLPTVKNLRVVLEVVIYERDSKDKGAEFIVQKILDPPDGKTSVVKMLGLPKGVEKGFGWDIIPDPNNPFEKPLPSYVTGRGSFTTPEGADLKYWRYTITLLVPMGAKDRATMAAPKTEAPKQ